MAQFGKTTILTEAIGTIKQTAKASADAGWLLCIGTAISRTTYASLFSAIGTTFGVGDGSTTFNLPDFRAASPVGSGTSTGYTANETVALGTKYDDSMQSHNHLSKLGSPSGSGDYSDIASRALAGSSGGDAFYDVVKAPSSDGVNGTPRTGTVTKGKTVGVNFQIKY